MTSTSVAEFALGENLPRYLNSPYTEVELESFGTHFTESCVTLLKLGTNSLGHLCKIRLAGGRLKSHETKIQDFQATYSVQED